MSLKFILFLFIFKYLEFETQALVYSRSSCPTPKLAHGRTRLRHMGQMARFSCLYRYQLVGNKYATCRSGQWDVDPPVCVRSGCDVPDVKNGLAFATHGDAWLHFFCEPGFKMVGSAVLFCDGTSWNSSAPKCVDVNAVTPLSCDFEEPDICGWAQDDMHDFDWKRWSGNTPSAFIMTGPSFDHTFGNKSNGYYMYIETTSRTENDTARLISPVYDKNLVKNGCFSFYYHMYGRTIGGLRVYQKPENLDLNTVEDKAIYLLFEQWGNQGDTWFRGASNLQQTEANFQIVIEGIRGKSFTSDIAVDDVALLSGDNCTAAIAESNRGPKYLPETCSGRCNLDGEPERGIGCSCTYLCLAYDNCCPDFADVCVFEEPGVTTDDSRLSIAEAVSTTGKPEGKATTNTKPNTKTTVAATTESTTTTSTTTTSTTTISTTTTTTVKPTTSTSTAPTPTTTKKRTIIQNLTSTIKPVTSSTVRLTTKVSPTKVVKTTPAVINYNTTKKISPSTWKITTTLSTFVPRTTTVKTQLTTHEQYNVGHSQTLNKQGSQGNSGVVVTIVVIIALTCFTLALVIALRSARGRLLLARARGQVGSDPEVRYLTRENLD